MVAIPTDRQRWGLRTTERAVERLYGHHDPSAQDSHDGYLNFGLWEPGITTYLEAAERMVMRMGELLQLSPRSRLVDAAPGRGTQDLALVRQFGPLEVDAVDITWKHVETARRRAHSQGVTTARFHHASAVALPFSAGQFTHALCLEAAHHFDTRERWLREAYRVLAPGGRLAMADFAIVRSPRGALQRAVYDAVCGAWSVPRANAITPDGYVELLRDIGFVDIELQQVGALTFPGYWQEQRRLERRREVLQIRGRLGAAVGVALNYGLVQLYEQGWVEYVLVSARKP